MIEVLLKITLAFFLTCLSLVVLGLDHGLNRHHPTCDRERIVITGKYGEITNGNDYTKDSHCEWLIKGMHHLELFLNLKFLFIYLFFIDFL